MEEPSVSDLAKIASETYKSPESRRDIGKYKFQYRKNPYISLYESDDHYVISHRGTSDLKQIEADYKLLTGVRPKYVSDRIKETEELIKSLNVNSSKKIIQIGHSLAGHIATESLRDPYINSKTHKVINFNPYTIHGTHSKLQKGAESKILNYITIGDIASAKGTRGRTIYYKRKWFHNAHTIDNFT